MRLFIAIQFPDRIKKALSYLQQDMRDIGIEGNYTKEENFHLTLVFIGEYKVLSTYNSSKKGILYRKS